MEVAPLGSSLPLLEGVASTGTTSLTGNRRIRKLEFGLVRPSQAEINPAKPSCLGHPDNFADFLFFTCCGI